LKFSPIGLKDKPLSLNQFALVILSPKEVHMKTEYSEKYYRAKLASISPSVDNIRLMIGTIRQAFNRSSLAQLEEVKRLQDIITLDLDEFFEEIEIAQAEPDNADNFYLKKLYGIIGQLEHIADEIKQMGEPIQRKIKEATLIADNDYFHVNDLFTHIKGLLRGLVDLFHAENPPLKKYLLAEANNMMEGVYKSVAEHERRMTHTFGQPHAFAIYFAIVEKSKFIFNHLISIVQIMDEKA
jgi:Na+/phosphate symporter